MFGCYCIANTSLPQNSRRFLFKQQRSDSKEVPNSSPGVEPRLPICLMTLKLIMLACRVCQVRSYCWWITAPEWDWGLPKGRKCSHLLKPTLPYRLDPDQSIWQEMVVEWSTSHHRRRKILKVGRGPNIQLHVCCFSTFSDDLHPCRIHA